MKFEDKLRSMTGKDVVLAMVAGLRNPHTKIDMCSFGIVRQGVCYGCAATNAICEIAGVGEEYVIERASLPSLPNPYTSVSGSKKVISIFEDAVDALRRGEVVCYNYEVENLGMLNLSLPSIEGLPYLYDDYTEKDLKAYEDYANTL